MTPSKYKSLNGFWLVLTALFLMPVGALKTPGQEKTAADPQTGEARILMTAVDRNGHFVNTLRGDDLKLFRDGVPQAISSLRQLTDRPVSLAILIDASASQERTLPGQKLAATSFIETIIRPDRDQAAVATFTGPLALEQKLTNDISLLRQAIARARFIPPPGYVRGGLVIGPPAPVKRTAASLASSTAVWDAVIEACSGALASSAMDTRRAIILLTDGWDTISQSKMIAAVDRAVHDGVAVYSIGIGDPEFGIDKEAMRKLSERTGGRAFFPKKLGELTGIFSEIGQELRSQYAISFSSTARPGAGRIKVELWNPSLRSAGVQLSYQQFVSNK
jgi:Ca-activated chloride channel family protein